MDKNLILGYGNPDRGDDGVAWYILMRLFEEKMIKDVDLFCCEFLSLNQSIDVWFNFQLLPEIAENLSSYKKAFFIDAHTGEIKDDIKLSKIKPVFDNSPFTHHMTPSSLLALTKTISGTHPQAWLLSVRGYEFEFNRTLSEKTGGLAEKGLSILKKKLFLE